MSEGAAGKRPKYLNLAQIRLPLPGVLSILHRISGALLIIALPFALAALHYSIAGEEEYNRTAALLALPPAKLLTWAAAWAFFHHLCAGVRFLLLDIHVGTSLAGARASAAAAFAASIAAALAFGVWLWL